MAEDEGDDCVKKAIEACVTAQAMIDINAEHLDGLRTQCATSAELTQHEIRTLESKLIKLFSRQLVAKRKCVNSTKVAELRLYPQLKQWLQVVGVSNKAIEEICCQISTLEVLLGTSEHSIKEVLRNSNAKDEEIRRLLIAVRNLKTYTERQIKGEITSSANIDLHWDSWDRNSTIGSSGGRTYHSRTARSSVPSDELLEGSSNPQSPPPVQGRKNDRRFPATPPPSKKPAVLLPDSFPLLTKSKSHEENLGKRIEPMDSSFPNCENLSRRRLVTEPGLESTGLGGHPSSLVSSPSRSPPVISPDNQNDGCFIDDPPSAPFIVPRSPCPPGMSHVIQHRFSPTVKVTICDLCGKTMFFGYKCKDCKYRCHRDCVERVPPSCGLPKEFVEEFARQLTNEDGIGSPSPIPSRITHVTSPPSRNKSESGRERKRLKQPMINIPPFACPDSSSNTSSCNSSTPSSPALVITPVQHTPSSASRVQQFYFPDVSDSDKDVTIETKPLIANEMVETQKSNDSDKTVSGTSGSGSTDSEKTLAGRVDSQDSQDMDLSDRSWPRQNSLSLREWDIPYDELQIEEEVGTGRFGTVYRGNWHGSVAIKMLNMNHVDDKKTLETFKQEVATFRKTRHDNLVLFMGACMKPPHLAIVTSLCKGMTLYTHIHLRKDKFNLNRTIIIAQQISQGMGYLHARDIVHKDLKTKNIFYENGKVIITDFGLFSITKLCRGNRKGDWLTIPQGWLCYLAPEAIRTLRAGNQNEADDLPFSTASDVYAFGTVWYELLCGEWPFKGQPAEVIIWQVGKGVKQSLTNIQASRDVKEILMMCWAFKPSERPDFPRLLDLFSKLPKKRLARSPSHPIHLSRSAESVF